MDRALESLVRERAEHRCEYCHFPEAFAEVPFQIDHIVAQQHGGIDAPDNLALACCFCNRFKGPNLSGIDPDTNQVVRLFDPRKQEWKMHFFWKESELIGKTEIGRATVRTLSINRPEAIAVRELLMAEGVFRI
jgi:5-methylcytosine-specific restriction endonuclease McrA